MVGLAQGCGVFIGLGSNLGPREAHICGALDELHAHARIRVAASSSLHETGAVGGPPGQPRYLNAVAELECELDARELLRVMQEIERRHGRARDVRHGPRTLDLDLLIYHDLVIDEPGLLTPHPRLWEREFVLAPLREVCGVEQFAGVFSGVVGPRRRRDRDGRRVALSAAAACGGADAAPGAGL
ncbi:MAG: 2-amino-4-hydroxy-6-hydroxymethyldihydropteridine diphosphokinase [Phycisphaerae bacterium]|nr:2-amino-4-hydroxy-6-hydroxymethyldihydropteridine diphosphokinase [Phycisphaerae bacterium]MCZ2400240.1 2-amino-4-hydroxy-6-hydroxymethyldihydropteridine diphosphokinase [Phycisphaerae bacterium]